MATTVIAKAWWKSKMLWLGIAQLTLGIAELVATTPVLQGSQVAAIAASIAGALTIAFRFVTERPVALSDKPVLVE